MKPLHAAALALVAWYLVYPADYQCIGFGCSAVLLRDYPEERATVRQKLINQREEVLVELSQLSPNDPSRKALEARAATITKELTQLDQGILDSLRGPTANRQQWRKIKRFDTARDCEKELATHGTTAQCIASDDPRLKPN